MRGPQAVVANHVLPVIAAPRDARERAEGSLDIRQDLLDLDGGPIERLVNDGTLAPLGSGNNKQIFRVVGKPWVVAVATAGSHGSKWRAVTSEIEQLLTLNGAGVKVPSLGPVTSAEQALVDVQMQGEPAKAFIEQFIDANHALGRQESHNYPNLVADEIERVIGGRKNFSADRWANANADLTALERYFEVHKDIPDFQVVIELGSGHIYTIVPGDPTIVGNLSSHKTWLQHWRKRLNVLRPTRL